MAERQSIGAMYAASRLRSGYVPESRQAAIAEIPDDHVIQLHFNLGPREDNSFQWITLFGGQSHGLSHFFESTLSAWQQIKKELLDLKTFGFSFKVELEILSLKGNLLTERFSNQKVVKRLL